MIEHEQPQQGGSYLRQADGSLIRVGETAAAALPAPATAVEPKPARPSAKSKDK